MMMRVLIVQIPPDLSSNHFTDYLLFLYSSCCLMWLTSIFFYWCSIMKSGSYFPDTCLYSRLIISVIYLFKKISEFCVFISELLRADTEQISHPGNGT